MEYSITVETIEQFNNKKKKYGEITKNKTTTKTYRILYPAMPGAQYNTNMFILYVCSYLFMTKILFEMNSDKN